jgi:tetratricopeptide (TPR) repeat protein
MLATLQLQAGEQAVLISETLPKLKTAAGTEDNYFVQIITAQIAEKNNELKKARTAYLRALALKPEVHALRNTVLVLDIRMNDKAAAAQHAKDFLYQDRELPLANYIVGSLALGEGDAKRALSYLTQATAPTVNPPLPEAFNDLAEAHRQLGDWAAALSAAEHACKLSPNLAIARETAAAALLELGRYADAHAYLTEAFELEAKRNPGKDPDPRLLITRARLHAKEGNNGLARVDLATARQYYDTLDRKAKAEFDALMQEVR